MITIYHVPGTRSVRPIWLCHELGLEIAIERIDPSPGYRRSPEWRAISPAGKVPAMRDGDFTMIESGAMVDYLLEKFDDTFLLHPEPATKASAEFHQWCWFAESTLLRPLGLRRVLREEADAKASVLVDAALSRFEQAMYAVEQALDHHEFLVEDRFSAADIMMGYALTLTTDRLDDYPRSRDYLERVTARAAYRKI